jgi:phage tail-like protein
MPGKSPHILEDVANCRFYLRIGSEIEARFSEASGLQVETTVQDYEEGGNNAFVHRLPGRTKVGNLTLKRGITKGSEFFKWYTDVANGNIVKKAVSLVIFAPNGDTVAHWDLVDAFPVKWVGPQLVADGTAVAVETLELAHAGLKWAL